MRVTRPPNQREIIKQATLITLKDRERPDEEIGEQVSRLSMQAIQAVQNRKDRILRENQESSTRSGCRVLIVTSKIDSDLESPATLKQIIEEHSLENITHEGGILEVRMPTATFKYAHRGIEFKEATTNMILFSLHVTFIARVDTLSEQRRYQPAWRNLDYIIEEEE